MSYQWRGVSLNVSKGIGQIDTISVVGSRLSAGKCDYIGRHHGWHEQGGLREPCQCFMIFFFVLLLIL